MYYNVISERIAKNLRYDLYHSLVNKDVEFFDGRKTGDLCKNLFPPSTYLSIYIYLLSNY